MSQTPLVIEKHIPIVSNQQSAIEALSSSCPEVSKQKLKQAMQFGAVWLTQKNQTSRLRRAKKMLHAGDQLHLYFDESKLFVDLTPAKLIVDEMEYSVWDKPCGMFSQGTKWGDHSAICRWIELYGFAIYKLSKRPCFLVHRLDRATSGLILVAHSKTMATALAELFESRRIKKHYSATVYGHFSVMKADQRIQQPIDGKHASTQLLSTDYDALTDTSKLRLNLETGRKHQIRKHLAGLGFPIVGDRLYSSINRQQLSNEDSTDFDEVDLKLRCCQLEFVSPINQKFCRYSIS